MPTVTAEFIDRREVRFETRGRTFTNVRAPAADGSGPTDYSSVELLLFAVGNCILGHLLNSPPLDAAEVTRAVASVEATMADFPRRVAHVHATVEIEVMDPSLLAAREAIEGGSCGGPMCSALGDLLSATVTLTLAGER